MSLPKQWIKGSVVNFICETKSVSKQDALIMVACPSKVVQGTETMLSKLATFSCIHWVVIHLPKNLINLNILNNSDVPVVQF